MPQRLQNRAKSRKNIFSFFVTKCAFCANKKGSLFARSGNSVAGADGERDSRRCSGYHAFLKELSVFLRGFLRGRLTGLPDDLEDLVQETLLAVHNQCHTYDPGKPLTSWVYAIARYKLVDLFRPRKAHDRLNDPLDEESAVFARSETEAVDARWDLGSLLGQLPVRQRLPIVHVKPEGLPVAETAKLTGMSESAVKVGVHRGLKALAVLLREGRS